ncbi:MAG: hypothetical protein J6U95_07650 [Alistipes sp.]|nr:hypothetical protein [Alistipes sp.]
MKEWVKHILPWVVGIAIFVVVGLVFYAPQFEGKSLGQGDIAQYAGMSQDIKEHREATGEDPQWTGNMFSGMPAYLIDVEYPTQDVKQSVGSIVKVIDGPMNMTLFAMVLMMVAVVLMGVNPWIGIIAGLAYGLSTYFFLIIDAGHITKMWALVYAPPLVASVWYALRKNAWLGALLAALFGSLELGANHPQITYYFLLVCVALWLSEMWYAYREKALKVFGRTTALLAVAALLAVGSNFSPLWYTLKHQKYTTRGVTESVSEEDARNAKIAYNTAWSYGKLESFNMLVPSYMGAWSGDYSEEAVAILQSRGVQEALLDGALNQVVEICREQFPDVTKQEVEEALQAGDEELLSLLYAIADRENANIVKYASNYWGGQPFTAGPTYLGAAAILLALLGLMLASDRDRWWIVASMLFMLLLAWGGNAMRLYELMYDILPGYKNFRTVSMALVVLEWAIPLLAAAALWQLWQSKLSAKQIAKYVGDALGVVVVLMVAMFALADYGLADINRELGNAWWVEQLKEAALTARRDAMLSDMWRSLLNVVLVAGGVVAFAWVREKESAKYRYWAMCGVVVFMGLVVTLDLVGVGKRYLGEDKWHNSSPTAIRPTEANREILQDTDLGYRVFDLDNYGSATAAYFHRSVDGYHGAKLGRYQEVMERYIAEQNGAVLAMLNTRYIISGEKVYGLDEALGCEPLGAAWFVEGVYEQPTAEKELEALAYVNLGVKAVVNQSAGEFAENYDATGSITLTQYAPNYLKYEYEAPAEALAVFSEIYFADGWKAYVDGVEAEYFVADYILRGMKLPEGKHVVEWKFKAPQWGMATAITGVCSWLILLGLVVAFVLAVRGVVKNKKR